MCIKVDKNEAQFWKTKNFKYIQMVIIQVIFDIENRLSNSNYGDFDPTLQV